MAPRPWPSAVAEQASACQAAGCSIDIRSFCLIWFVWSGILASQDFNLPHPLSSNCSTTSSTAFVLALTWPSLFWPLTESSPAVPPSPPPPAPSRPPGLLSHLVQAQPSPVPRLVCRLVCLVLTALADSSIVAPSLPPAPRNPPSSSISLPSRTRISCHCSFEALSSLRPRGIFHSTGANFL